TDDGVLGLVEEDVASALSGTGLAGSRMVRCSSKTGTGLDDLRREVRRLAGLVPQRAAQGPAFLPLDRVFTLAGHGTGGTRTLLRGALAPGDALEAVDDPGVADDLRVRGLHSLGEARASVVAGMRTAVNLAGPAVASVRRGTTLAHAGAFVASDELIV